MWAGIGSAAGPPCGGAACHCPPLIVSTWFSAPSGESTPIPRTGTFCRRVNRFEPIWPVLQRYLGEVRPACTVIVAQLLDPRMLIEVEVTAFKP